MKKLICMLIALLVGMSLCGCSQSEEAVAGIETTQQNQVETSVPEETVQLEEARTGEEAEGVAEGEVVVEEAAAPAEFTPSVEYKGGPEILTAYMNDAAVEGCLIITNVEQAREKLTDITQEERDLLIEIYEKLVSGEMTLPVAQNHMIRELVDVHFKYQACRVLEEHNHKDVALAEENVVVTLTFDLGIEKDAQILILSYQEDAWVEAAEVVNNGDGTVTCKLEDEGPIVFVVLG